MRFFSRREMVGRMLSAFVPALLLDVRQEGRTHETAQDAGSDDSLPTLRYVREAGMRERITDWDNEPRVIAIEKRLRCMCGCNQSIYQCRTTDFTCPLWPITHPRIVSLVQDGRTAQEIIDTFMAEDGEEVLMAPIPAGFNLTAYFLPGAVIALVGSGMLWVLGRRALRAREVAGEADGDFDPDIGLTREEQESIRAELKKLDL